MWVKSPFCGGFGCRRELPQRRYVAVCRTSPPTVFAQPARVLFTGRVASLAECCRIHKGQPRLPGECQTSSLQTAYVYDFSPPLQRLPPPEVVHDIVRELGTVQRPRIDENGLLVGEVEALRPPHRGRGVCVCERYSSISATSSARSALHELRPSSCSGVFAIAVRAQRSRTWHRCRRGASVGALASFTVPWWLCLWFVFVRWASCSRAFGAVTVHRWRNTCGGAQRSADWARLRRGFTSCWYFSGR